MLPKPLVDWLQQTAVGAYLYKDVKTVVHDLDTRLSITARRLAGTALLAAALASSAFTSAAPADYVMITKQAVATTTKQVSILHIVQPGERLWTIAKNSYGIESAIADSVASIVNRNKEQLPYLTIDNKAFENGTVVNKSDGITGDIIKVGDRLLLGTRAETITVPYTKHEYHQVPTKLPLPLIASTLLFGVLGTAVMLAPSKRTIVQQRAPDLPLEKAIDLYYGRDDTRALVFESSLASITSETGVTTRELYRAIEKRGLAKRGAYRTFTKEYCLSRTSEMLTQHAQVKDIADTLHVSTSTIYRWQKQQNI